MARRMLGLLVVPAFATTLGLAYEFKVRDTDFSVSGVVAAAVQCDDERCGKPLPFQPEMSFRLDDSQELLVRLGLASGYGLNETTAFNIAPWAADLEGDVQSINGRSRNHVLTAWYRYTVALGDGSSFGTSVGIIDATDYLDDNAYSNDEYTQFMNSALVNGPNVFLPSYDRGLALDWTGLHWSVRTVYMNVGENDDGNEFNYVGAQMGYRVDTPLGEGNYRLLLGGTDHQFLDPTGTSLESRASVLISCDQQLGRTFGLFTRLAWQSQDAAVDYGTLYSGGIDIRGLPWGRRRDNLGIGYAYLGGGNGDLVRSQVMETYYRVAVNGIFSVTGDVQYMRDDRAADESLNGFVLGLRIAAEF